MSCILPILSICGLFAWGAYAGQFDWRIGGISTPRQRAFWRLMYWLGFLTFIGCAITFWWLHPWLPDVDNPALDLIRGG